MSTEHSARGASPRIVADPDSVDVFLSEEEVTMWFAGLLPLAVRDAMRRASPSLSVELYRREPRTRAWSRFQRILPSEVTEHVDSLVSEPPC